MGWTFKRETINAALFLAVSSGDRALIKRWLEKGADLHANDDHALRLAAERGRLEIIEYLVEAGSNPDHPCLFEAAKTQASIRSWLEHRRLKQGSSEPIQAKTGLKRGGAM